MNKEVLKKLNQRPIAYYPIYADIAKSLHGGVLLSQLMYWFSKKDTFYKTNKDLMVELNFTERQLKTANSKIKNLAFIKVELKGLPCKNWYTIDWDEYYTELSNTVLPSQDETVPTGEDETVPTGEDETVPTFYKSKTSSKTTSKSGHAVIKTKAKDLQPLSETEKNEAAKAEPTLNEKSELIYSYFNKINNTCYKPTSPSNKKLVSVLIKHDFTLIDFKIVIDKMHTEWSNDSKMFKYNRPSTIFNVNKFEGYLNSKSSKDNTQKKKTSLDVYYDNFFKGCRGFDY